MEDFMKILRADQQQRKQEQARMAEIVRVHTETVNRMTLNLGYIARPVCKTVTGLDVFINCNLN